MNVLKKAFRWEYGALIAVLALAFFFRVYGLDKVPPAFFPDEGNIAIDAQLIQQGHFYFITPHEGGEGSLFAYLMAATFSLFGASIASARGLVVAISVVGIGATYFLVRQLFAATLSHRQSFVVAIVAVLLLSVARWHVSHSRIAFAVNLGLLVQAACFWALWRMLSARKILWAVVAGVLLGLTAFAYVPFKLTPLILLIFFLADAIVRRKSSPFLRTHFSLLVLVAVIGGMFYGTLMGVYLFGGLQRSMGSFTFLSPVINHGDPWGTLFKSVVGSFAGFVPFVRQVMGVPIAHGLDNLSLGLFLVGLGIVIWQHKKPPYLFLGIWWLIMFAPCTIAPEGAVPHLRRAIGAITPTVILTGLAIVVTLSVLMKRYPRWQKTFLAIGALLVAISTVTLVDDTYTRYYLHQLNSEAIALTNHIYDFELADTMVTEGDADTIYILPADTASGALYPESATLEFLYKNRGKAAYAYVWDDQTTLFADVRSLVAGKSRVGVIHWKVSKHTGADPAGVLHYIFEKWGTYQNQTQHKYFDIDYFQLDTSAPEISQAPLTTANVSFEGKFALTGFAFAPTVVADEPVWVELAWQKLAAETPNVQVGIWLEDGDGHIVGQTDKPLLSNKRHRGTETWDTGGTERDYYLLSVTPGTPPGRYRLKTVLYRLDENGQSHRFAPSVAKTGADLAYPLGETQLLAPKHIPEVKTLGIAQPVTPILFGDSLRFIGYDQPFPTQLRPGDRGTAVLWWQSSSDTLPPNITVSAQLANDGETIHLGQPQLLGGDSFPTQQWRSGMVVRQFLDYIVPAETPSGEYQLQLLLTGVSAASVSLGQVTVAGRPRNFTVPYMQHSMNVTFGDIISLLGYDLNLPETSPGTVNLTLYWQSQRETVTAYKVFVHLLDADGQIVAQIDREPQNGAAPTTGWISGEVITDELQFSAVDLSAVTAIRVGLYNPADGRRLPVSAGSDSVTLTW